MRLWFWFCDETRMATTPFCVLCFVPQVLLQKCFTAIHGLGFCLFISFLLKILLYGKYLKLNFKKTLLFFKFSNNLCVVKINSKIYFQLIFIKISKLPLRKYIISIPKILKITLYVYLVFGHFFVHVLRK